MADRSPQHDEPSPLQGYYDWQVNTLMLAYDLVDPIARDDEAVHRRRRTEVEEEVRRFSLEVIPQQFKDDPSLDWPPEVMTTLTRATFNRVRVILGE